MKDIRFFRVFLLVLILAVIFTIAYTSSQFDQISCMEVPVLSDADTPSLMQKIDTNLSGYFFFKGEPAAVDWQTGTIYISQKIDQNTRYQDLDGSLSLAYQDFSLYFLPDPCFSDLQSAMAANHPFRLLAVNPAGDYAEYNVIFTSFPIINLTEDGTGNGDKLSPHSGKFCLWTSDDPEQPRYSVTTSLAKWHVRGMTSASISKKPWKLTLTNHQAPIKLSLLGLGKDDDWILNPMNLDDTLLKEQLFMKLWNQLAAETYNYPMSSGEYVEVIINREYRGVYLMQRRIDQNYLELPTEGILFKGINNSLQATVQDTYELIYSPLDTEESYALLDNIWNRDYSMYDVNNFIDVNLFLHFAAAPDNAVYPKNMYYFFNPTASGYAVTLIPWDTDMSFGVVWEDGFVYNYEDSINRVTRRMEYRGMQELHPDLDDRMAARWQELRNGVLSEENILSVLSELEASLLKNGASVRDSQKWGNYYGGSDTVNSLYRYIREKLPLMDAFYAQ